MSQLKKKTIFVVPVSQWIDSWFPAYESRLDGFPKKFYMTSMPLKDLRSLSAVRTRLLDERKDPESRTYQRVHQPERSKEIARYISYGYPLSKNNLRPEDHETLIHPGWLPTAILVNVISPSETRRNKGKDLFLKQEHQIILEEKDGNSYLSYPIIENISGENLAPIEIIDGQHRLYAMDSFDDDELDSYEVPVVMFFGLPLDLQAYLFWVINVEPKRINPSLAFDLYPELRNQDWLERGEGVKVYQEHRAQELTEISWNHPESPWQYRIELHGNRVAGHVSNAAYLRSLNASFVRRWSKNDERIGGLFGSIDKDGALEHVIPWKRSQQAAFLIYTWRKLHDAVTRSNVDWVQCCRDAGIPENFKNPKKLDLAFCGPNTLLATDQGVRAVMRIMNAMCYVNYEEIGLDDWEMDGLSDNVTEKDIVKALGHLKKMGFLNEFLDAIGDSLINGGFDWRVSSAPGLNNEQKAIQSGYRGSSGYTLLFNNCMRVLLASESSAVREAANDVASRMGLSSW